MSPRKTKKGSPKKMSATVQAAVITTIGTVAVALITGLFAWSQNQPAPIAVPTVDLEVTETTAQSITEPTPSESSFTWLGEPISEKDLYPTGDAKYSFSPDTGLDVTGRYSNDRVWINKTLPKNFSVTLSFTLSDDKCLMYTGIGDGHNHKNSYAWFLYQDTGRFYKNSEETIEFASEIIDAYPINQPSTYILQRLDNSIILKNANDVVAFRIQPVDQPEWSDLHTLNVFWLFAGGTQECTIRYNSMRMSEIK